jgi:predicted metal-dependent HD superfamily phosphohydrolase
MDSIAAGAGQAGAPSPLAGLLDAGLLAELRRRHDEPHRPPGAWAAMGERLALAEEVLNGIAGHRAFILAVLFRHAVQEPRRADNAERSIALMQALLGQRVPAAVLARAAALIGAAARGEVPETPDVSLRGDAALFLDIDLAVLGAPEARYEAHEAALRQEHAQMGEDAYAAARSAALQMLLWRDRLYRTDRFHLERERRARRNIERTIARLRGGR